MGFAALLNKLLLLVLLMLIGYIGARRKSFGPEFTRAASKLTVNVFLSASVIYSVTDNPPVLSGGELLQVILICSLVMLLSYAGGFLAARIFPVEPDRKVHFELLISAMNPMFIGLPVAQILFGSQGVFYVALLSIPFNVLLYTYGVWRLKGGQGGSIWRDLLSVPLLATLAAILIFLLRIPVPQALRDLVGTISAATIPMSMIVIGASLGRVNPLEAFRQKSLYLAALLRLIALPLLTWLLLSLIPMDPVLRGSMLVVAACPSAVLISVLSIQYGQDVTYCSEGILLTTVLSMLSIPALIALLL